MRKINSVRKKTKFNCGLTERLKKKKKTPNIKSHIPESDKNFELVKYQKDIYVSKPITKVRNIS
jgi:hypothetical protein